jgi:uncharacterized protein YjbI with pentapeptide repeats
VSYCPTVQIQINLNGFLKESLVMNSENTAAIPTKEELIALLKSGKIEEFNRVRLAREIDLAGASLRGANLDGVNLTRANLTGADLNEADLTGACLIRADLNEANLTGADLTGANLTEARLIGANLAGANLTGANLHGAYIIEANLFEVKGLSEEQRRLIIHKLQASWE